MTSRRFSFRSKWGSGFIGFGLAVALLFAAAGPVMSAKPRDGQAIFRFDTFGDEQLWTDTLRMHEVIASSVSPVIALSVGLKVDADALPPDFLTTHDLNDPATTVELLRLNAVVGLKGARSPTASSSRSASRVPSAIRRSTMLPASASAWTAGQTSN